MKNQHKSEYEIGNWKLPQGDVLAPMAGISDSPFRRLTREYGAGLLYTECISAEGVRRLGKISLELAHFHQDERPIAVQLFGSDPDQFADAAAVITEKYQPDMMDINCGCPVKRFVTRGCGGYLMQKPELIGRIVEGVKNQITVPVSVKLRRGYIKPDETAIPAAIAAYESGASLITVHGRFVRGAKGTKADWDVIGKVKNAVPTIPVIGNGDIFSFSDAKSMIAHTGCDRVMIGRWAGGKPWIFKDLLKGYPLDEDVELPSPVDRINILLKHYHLMLDHFSPRFSVAVHRMRKHIPWYTHGMPGAGKFRGEIMTLEDPSEVIERIIKFQSGL